MQMALISFGPSASSYRVKIPEREAADPKDNDESETVKTADAEDTWSINDIHPDPKCDGQKCITK
jgi:hypothetical protein